MKYVWHLRWILPAAVVMFIAWQTFFGTSPLTGSTDFVARTSLFQVLLPAGRVERVQPGMSLQTEPVYIDVRIPPRTVQVTLELTATPDSVPLQLGVRQGNGFEYLFKGQEIQGTGVRRYSLRATSFSYLEPGRRLRFIVSAPKLQPGSIVITGASVNIMRQGFSWAWLSRALASL
ncbi:MAG: hypothetical protein HY974_00895 [Candidatus Kerfeldbacteria bacterium]|nr:hypothetical protein [Candidatus Kerfeldbacteria bacterium]